MPLIPGEAHRRCSRRSREGSDHREADEEVASGEWSIAGKAYDIAGRPPVLRRRGNCSREQGTGGWPMVRGWPRAQPAVGLTRDWWSVEGKVPTRAPPASNQRLTAMPGSVSPGGPRPLGAKLGGVRMGR
jgi:hypothetical protein